MTAKTYVNYIWDTTLRDGEQAPGFALNPEQKVEVARCLEKIGVDTIEVGMPANQEHDFPAIRAVSQAVGNIEIAAFVRATSTDIELAARALEKAKKPYYFFRKIWAGFPATVKPLPTFLTTLDPIPTNALPPIVVPSRTVVPEPI